MLCSSMHRVVFWDHSLHISSVKAPDTFADLIQCSCHSLVLNRHLVAQAAKPNNASGGGRLQNTPKCGLFHVPAAQRATQSSVQQNLSDLSFQFFSPAASLSFITQGDISFPLNGIFSLNTSFLFLRCMRIHELGVGVKFLYLSLIQIKKLLHAFRIVQKAFYVFLHVVGCPIVQKSDA